MLQTLLAFIFVFGIIVLIHEFGHYIFAKRAGILVREFSIGFGPKLFSFRRGETAFTVRLLPLGGYVMMAGYEEEEDLRPGMLVTLKLNENNRVVEIDTTNESTDFEDLPIEVIDFDLTDDLFIEGSLEEGSTETRRFQVHREALVIGENGVGLQIAPRDRRIQHASVGNKLITNFAGPLNNFILGIIAFILVAFLQGGVPTNEPVVGEVMENTPAASAGLMEGDNIQSINGESIDSFTDAQVIFQENPGEELTIVLEREGNQEEINVTPKATEIDEEVTVGQVGMYRPMDDSFLSKISYGFTETWSIITGIIALLATIFTGGFSINNLGGPVAIYAVTETVVNTGGFISLIGFMASLSVNLGVVNLVPIPGLDGGKLVLNVIEAIRGKPVSQEVETMITLVSAVLLLILVVFVTWNDIQRFFF